MCNSQHKKAKGCEYFCPEYPNTTWLLACKQCGGFSYAQAPHKQKSHTAAFIVAKLSAEPRHWGTLPQNPGCCLIHLGSACNRSSLTSSKNLSLTASTSWQKMPSSSLFIAWQWHLVINKQIFSRCWIGEIENTTCLILVTKRDSCKPCYYYKLQHRKT